MKDNSILDHDITNLEIVPKAKDYILGAAKWGRYVAVISMIVFFISILGFLLILTSIYFDPTLSEEIQYQEDVLIGLIILALIFIPIILFTSIPVYFLFRFSTKTINAIKMASSHQLEVSFKNLQSLFKYITILTVSIIGIYFILIIALGFFAGTSTY